MDDDDAIPPITPDREFVLKHEINPGRVRPGDVERWLEGRFKGEPTVLNPTAAEMIREMRGPLD